MITVYLYQSSPVFLNVKKFMKLSFIIPNSKFLLTSLSFPIVNNITIIYIIFICITLVNIFIIEIINIIVCINYINLYDFHVLCQYIEYIKSIINENNNK